MRDEGDGVIGCLLIGNSKTMFFPLLLHQFSLQVTGNAHANKAVHTGRSVLAFNFSNTLICLSLA